MTQLNGHLKDFPKSMVMDEKIMLSIARMIAYVMAFSTDRKSAPADMTKHAIELDAKLVDNWLMKGEKDVCEKCESER